MCFPAAWQTQRFASGLVRGKSPSRDTSRDILHVMLQDIEERSPDNTCYTMLQLYLFHTFCDSVIGCLPQKGDALVFLGME